MRAVGARGPETLWCVARCQFQKHLLTTARPSLPFNWPIPRRDCGTTDVMPFAWRTTTCRSWLRKVGIFWLTTLSSTADSGGWTHPNYWGGFPFRGVFAPKSEASALVARL